MSARNSKSTELPVKFGLTPKKYRAGSAYVLAAMALIVLTFLGLGMLTVAGQSRYAAIKFKNEAVSMLVAEAGYEKAVYWMGRQQDMLTALQNQATGTTGSLNFPDGTCNYKIELYTFAGARPVYRIVSDGRSGAFGRTVDVLVMQAISGWDMGLCRVPGGGNKTYPVYFADGEIVDIPIHINDFRDSPDYRDIYIMGDPRFLRDAAIGESRETDGGADKYAGVMDMFEGGIYFDQPDSRVTDEASVAIKVERFKDATEPQYQFTPVATKEVKSPNAAVQLEFFVGADGEGKVRVTNNATVRGFKQGGEKKTWDFKIKSGKTDQYERYEIYAYHVIPDNAEATGQRVVRDIAATYVTQNIGGVESEPGGQIFVDGNVIIGGDATTHNGDQVVKGKITVVATGNIWVADSVVVDGPRDADGRPSMDNPNILGLIAQGVVKVVDPGMSEYTYVEKEGMPEVPTDYQYVPIGVPDSSDAEIYQRHLPDPMVVEAAITVGGGGWGAENVTRYDGKYYGGRKEASGTQDYLVLRGSLTEAIRGVVGMIGMDGYYKQYYIDERLLQGILPGDIWLRGKYIPAPAGWSDYQSRI